MSLPAAKMDPKLMARLWIDRTGPSFIDLVATVDEAGFGLRATVRIAPKEGQSAIVLYDEMRLPSGRGGAHQVKTAEDGFVIKLEKMGISIKELSGEKFSINIEFRSENISISLCCCAPKDGVEGFLKSISKLEM